MAKETFKRMIIYTAHMPVISVPKLFLEQGKFRKGERVKVTIESIEDE